MYRVLVVDDEILVREAISENICWRELGYELVGTCQNGKEAMEFLAKNSVDVVLTDICMPYADGMELSEFIYKNFPETSIIIFSGFDEFEYAKKAIKYNVEEYLLKPVTASELSKVLTDLKEKKDRKKEQEKEIDLLNETYKKNKIFIKSKILADFITGSKTEKESFKDLREANIVLNAPYYRVAIAEIGLNSELFDPEDQLKQQTSLWAFSVHNIIDEILTQHRVGVACLADNNRVFILFQINKQTELNSKVKKICAEIRDKVEKYMKLGVTIGIGTSVKSQKYIYQSYEAAKNAMQYQYLFGENSIIDMEDMIGNMNQDVEIDEKIDALIMLIKLNDGHKIDDTLNSIKETIKRALVDQNRSNLYLQQIVLAVSDTLRVSDLTDSIIYAQKNELLSNIASSKTLDEAMKFLRDYCIQVANELVVQKNTDGKRALLAMDFIEKHYGDTNLNLNTVCSYLNISVSRFSTIFKNATGETFMEALIRTRIQKAKELLENTDLKNYEIADRVGFSDPHYFSVVFKKMTGKTPTKYAKEKR